MTHDRAFLKSEARPVTGGMADSTPKRERDPAPSASAPLNASEVAAPSDAPNMPKSDRLEGLERCVEELGTLGAISVEVIEDLRLKLASHRFDLVVAGQFKRGKTSLVNALLGADLLPVAVVPLTSIVTAITHGARSSASVVLETGETKSIALTDLPDYITERGNPNNRKGVREAHVTFPSPWLKDGIRLVDTPGVGSIYQKNTDVANRFLPKADAVLFLLSVDQPIGQAEGEFLANVRQYSDKIFFILNKIDLLSEAELAESIEFTRQALSSLIGHDPKLFPFSARLALAPSDSSERLHASGMSALSAALAAFLKHDKDSVLLISAVRQIRQAVSMARFSIQLELEALTAPLAELECKARLFHERKREILLAKDDFDVLLGNDAARALQRPLDEHLAAFKDDLKRRILSTLDARYADERGTRLRRLQGLLEDTAIREIQRAFDVWQSGETESADSAFTAFCARHAARIDDMIEEILRFASDLFALPVVPQRATGFQGVASHFYYKFWSEPTSLRILSSSLVFALPRALGARVILERARRFALERVEMQAGRMRYDFSQRLDKALAAFKHDVADKLDAVITSIELAMNKASQLRSAGESAAIARHALLSTLQSLDDIDKRIGDVAKTTREAAASLPSESVPAERVNRTQDASA